MAIPTTPRPPAPTFQICFRSPLTTAAFARRLDRLADCELQHGHHLAAEQLSRRAAELRDDCHASR